MHGRLGPFRGRARDRLSECLDPVRLACTRGSPRDSGVARRRAATSGFPEVLSSRGRLPVRVSRVRRRPRGRLRPRRVRLMSLRRPVSLASAAFAKSADGLARVALDREGVDSAPSRASVTWLILPVVICLSQRLSHACLSMNASYCETANGSLNQL